MARLPGFFGNSECTINVATRAALPQNRVKTLIGSEASYEITNIRILL